MNEKIGRRIKLIRHKLGLTMEEFGDLFEPKASKGVVSNWENNYNLPNNERLKKIAELGNVSMTYLLNGDESDKKEILKKQLLNLQEEKMNQTLHIAQFARELSSGKWDEEIKKRIEKDLQERTLTVEKISEAIDEVTSHIERLKIQEEARNKNKELNKNLPNWGDPEDIPTEEVKKALEKSGYKVKDTTATNLDLETILTSHQEITYKGKTLTDKEKQKVLQVLSITLED